MKYKSLVNARLLVWNPLENRKLCQFENGEYEAETKEEKKILDTIPGVVRSDGTSPTEAESKPVEAAEIPLDEQSVKQIKAFAKQNGIDLPKSATTKKAILAVIDEALAE